MKYLLILLILPLMSIAQSEYPTDYFGSPLEIPIVLAGTFAELRPNHFHSGLDIKTQGKQGLKVYSSADGYVSRIKISHYGYGKALYITHPNGYTTVYAHLQKLSPSLEKYIKDCQYEKESYEVEMFPSPDELSVKKGELIAYSGNSGSSGGPHLHYEIRDNEERPINPLLFGFEVPDTKVPRIQGLFAYTKNKDAHVNNFNGRTNIRLIPTQKGDYTTESIIAEGEIGFGVIAYDQQDMAFNKNGLSNIQTFNNGSKSLEIDFRRFSFAETSLLNRLIDYEYYKTEKARIQKLFIEANNPLSLYKDSRHNGYINVKDSTSNVYKIRIRDFKGNESWISIPIDGKKRDSIKYPQETNNYKLLSNQPFIIEQDRIKVIMPANSLYEDAEINYEIKGDTLKFHKDVIPLRKSFSLEYDISQYSSTDQEKLFIARLYGYKEEPSFISARRDSNILKARSKVFGKFTLAMDTVSPTIKAHNFKEGQWVSSNNKLLVKIEDDLSGISEYRATINGKWILMEYEYKNNTLTYDFGDGIVEDSENKLKVIVTDNVGNSSTFEATFFRK